MEDKLMKKKNGYTSTATATYQLQPREYNELLHIIAQQKKIIEDVRFECSNGKDNVPVSRLRKILEN